jgi:hypothetical protein
MTVPDDPDDFEQFDEDNLRLDPLEEGMDPPEHWAQADKFGNTEREMREGQDLNHRLAEEQPDDGDLGDAPDGGDPDGDDLDLDSSVDEESYDLDNIAPDEPRHPALTEAERDGTSADEAGGSVAEELRTPPGEAR